MIKEASKDFWQAFQQQKSKIQKLAKNDLKQAKIEFVNLQQKLVDASIYLPAYDQGSCQNQLKSLGLELSRLEPTKQKFTFKKRIVQKKDNVEESNQVDQIQNEFLRICGENSVLEPVTDQDVTIDGIDHCVVLLQKLDLATLYINNCKNSIIVCKVRGSIFCDNISNSILVSESGQLRIHHTVDTIFYSSIMSTAIIEDSKNIQFGNNGPRANVNDFNWLRSDPSPNWSYKDAKFDHDVDSLTIESLSLLKNPQK